MNETKPSNPKDAMGIKKVPMSCVSAPVLAEVGLGMLEGALKYGRHNYRAIGVRSSVYYDAALRHMMAWWEGEDIDPDSGLSHVSKAIASLAVLRDAAIQGNLNDDRPPKSKDGWIAELNKQAEAIIAKYPNPVLPYTQRDASWVERGSTTGPERSVPQHPRRKSRSPALAELEARANPVKACGTCGAMFVGGPMRPAKCADGPGPCAWNVYVAP